MRPLWPVISGITGNPVAEQSIKPGTAICQVTVTFENQQERQQKWGL